MGSRCASNAIEHKNPSEPSHGLIRLTSQPLEEKTSSIATRKPAMLALWINTKEQRSEGSFAGYSALHFHEYIVLPAQFSPRKALRC